MKIIKTLLLISILTNISYAQDVKTIWLEESPERMNWTDAMKYCKDSNAILPDRKTFKTIWLANNKTSEIIGFDLSVSYWTSDEVQNNKYAAYPFYFGEGRDTWYYKADHYGVRCIKK